VYIPATLPRPCQEEATITVGEEWGNGGHCKGLLQTHHRAFKAAKEKGWALTRGDDSEPIEQRSKSDMLVQGMIDDVNLYVNNNSFRESLTL